MTNRMGPQVTAPQDLKPDTGSTTGEALKARPKLRLPTPEALADVALIDATTCAATGSMGVSWWHDKVKTGEAPQPAIREPRCTRWRLADVRAFWLARAEKAAADTQAATTVTRAKKASTAAQARRRAQAATTQAGA